MHLDTVAMKGFLPVRKMTPLSRFAKTSLLRAQRNCRIVRQELLTHFCGVCTSLTLTIPDAWFYTRSIYFNMRGAEQEERAQFAAERRRWLAEQRNISRTWELPECQ